MAEARKIVTVVFADVVGSTALGEELDPETVRHAALDRQCVQGHSVRPPR